MATKWNTAIIYYIFFLMDCLWRAFVSYWREKERERGNKKSKMEMMREKEEEEKKGEKASERRFAAPFAHRKN